MLLPTCKLRQKRTQELHQVGVLLQRGWQVKHLTQLAQHAIHKDVIALAGGFGLTHLQRLLFHIPAFLALDEDKFFAESIVKYRLFFIRCLLRKYSSLSLPCLRIFLNPYILSCRTNDRIVFWLKICGSSCCPSACGSLIVSVMPSSPQQMISGYWLL